MLAATTFCLSALHADHLRASPSRVRSVMMAEPQIDWQAAAVVSNEPLARGTMQLRLKASEPHGYKAGHILGFEMAHPKSGEPLKGPYTVTRPVGLDEFDIIYRVIPDGRKTPYMQDLVAGCEVRFGGKFGTPVADGVADGCDRFVGVATGAGIGPLVGYAEAALVASSGPARIELFCGFKDLADACGSACETLEEKYPERFSWTPVISQPMACTAIGLAGFSGTSSLASSLLQVEEEEGVAEPAVAAPSPPSFLQGRVNTAVPCALGDTISGSTHFHLVGNGAFIADFKQGLLEGGVAEERVTTEKYFNGKAEPNADAVAFIAEQVRKRLDLAPVA